MYNNSKLKTAKVFSLDVYRKEKDLFRAEVRQDNLGAFTLDQGRRTPIDLEYSEITHIEYIKVWHNEIAKYDKQNHDFKYYIDKNKNLVLGSMIKWKKGA